jgi:pantoate--beta-alanine ligase
VNKTPPVVVRTVADLRAHVATWRHAGETVGLVPTMGALHEGHLSLARLARSRADRVVVSIFVNPTQFAPHEDLDAYPRREAADIAALAAEPCDLVFAPTAEEMYPRGFATAITVAGVSAPMDGAARPHHFGGVATVVAKLLIQCAPDVAVFGEKDYQQLQVIRRLTIDLNLPVEIVGAPIIRDADGLALSSRNAYLSEQERPIAGRLNVIMKEAVEALRRGATIAQVEAQGLAALVAAGFNSVDYFDIRDAATLAALTVVPSTEGAARVFVAARIGKTRLIDNMAV